MPPQTSAAGACLHANHNLSIVAPKSIHTAPRAVIGAQDPPVRHIVLDEVVHGDGRRIRGACARRAAQEAATVGVICKRWAQSGEGPIKQKGLDFGNSKSYASAYACNAPEPVQTAGQAGACSYVWRSCAAYYAISATFSTGLKLSAHWKAAPGQWHSRQAVRFSFDTPMVLMSSMLAMRSLVSSTLAPSTTIASGHFSCARQARGSSRLTGKMVWHADNAAN